MDRRIRTRDAQEHADVVLVLFRLPPEHPARIAYAERAGTIRLTHLVGDDPKLAEALKEAFLRGDGRIWNRTGGPINPTLVVRPRAARKA